MNDHTNQEFEPLAVPIWPDAAKMLGIGRGLAYAMAKDGRIPVIQLGKRKVVPLARLRAMAA